MIAVVYHGPDDLRVEERPIPTITDDEVLIKVLSTGICGTDIRILHGSHRMYPAGTIRIPGHEVVGEIVEPGSLLNDLHAGMRVFVAPNMGCGHCRQCISGNNNRCAQYAAIGVTLDGSFAEYIARPSQCNRPGEPDPCG